MAKKGVKQVKSRSNGTMNSNNLSLQSKDFFILTKYCLLFLPNQGSRKNLNVASKTLNVRFIVILIKGTRIDPNE